MTESPVLSIEIVKEIPFFGEGDTLESRLRNVSLRGFPNVKIYEKAIFQPVYLNSEEIADTIHTPQLRVYRNPNLERIDQLAKLFQEKGIDILRLNKAYDYVATHQSGDQTEWTMIPPIVERFHIPKDKRGKLHYEPLIGNELAQALKKEGLWINPEASNLNHSSESEIFDLINDGSHRIHYGFEKGGLIVLRISGVTQGYPYYAAPQKYNVRVFETREEALSQKETKVHIIQEPGQKNLYRLFPSGGIKSGSVRPH